ncbi:MAG TPA: cohesin domain-containing protein [Bacteroidales bacterium]|nr:cohesin domain-containing protein [Bacteroidales bacterium]
MRKIILLLIFIAFAGIAYTQSATATISNHQKYPGSVSIPVDVTNFVNIGSISIHYSFDPAVLTFNGFTNPNPGTLPGMEANALQENGVWQIGISWSISGAGGANVPDGNLIIINFTYNGGTSDLNFIANRCEVSDGDLEPISVLYVDGSISPLGNAYVEIPQNLLKDPNSLISVPLNVNFSEVVNGVGSFTFVIDFDPDILSFHSLANEVLSDITADEITASRISISWLNPDLSGSFLNGALVDIRFNYTIGTSALSFVEELSSMGDNSGLDINALFTDGLLSQNPATIASVSAGQVTMQAAGGEINVPITVDFSGISGGVSSFNFIIGYDNSVLSFQTIANAVLSPVTFDVLSSSSISVSWINPGGTGSTFIGKLLDLHFAFQGGYSEIHFDAETCEMGDNNALDVNAAYTDGWVSQDPATIVQVMAGTLEATAGSQVDVPITVQNFDNVGSFDYYITFDPLILEFVSLEAINAGIGLGTLESNIINGNTLGINWIPATGLTLADDTKLFDIRFNFTGSQSTLTFDPDNCSMSDISANTLYAEYTNGSVSEDIPLDISVEIADALAQPGSVNVPVTANDFSGIGTFDFEIEFDPTILSFVNLTDELADLDSYGELLFNNVGNKILIAWNVDTPAPPGAPTGLDMEDGEKLFDLSFTYLGGESDLTFVTAGCSVSDFELELLDVSFLSGSVKGGIDVTLNLFLEGLYNVGTGAMNKAKDNVSGSVVDKFPGTVADTITVELHSSSSYGTIVHTIYGVELNQDGTASFSIPSEFSSSYYITVKHRNHITTVSGSGLSFASTQVNYSYTAGVGSAFGGNLKQLASGVFGIYLGDINHDGSVDINDSGPVIIAVGSGSVGYILSDINGDGYVDINDSGPVINNVRNGIASQLP